MYELLVVLAIVAIALTIGIPVFSGWMRNQRLTVASNDFLAAINLARAEAIQRGRRIDLIPRDGTDWASGWVVFIDDNDNQRIDLGERIVFSHGPIAGGMRLQSTLTDSRKPYLAYNGNGRTRTNASNQTPQLGTISFLLDNKSRRIKLNFLGRARLCNPESDRTCTGPDDSS
ncbi:MAG: GspH/FimT family pseudopilin [Proteobacteria bacterium]|nr:GspH/FimT family pseudopilin [Pseudomonadota bacterium]